MHEISIVENIESWRFERCPCGLCIATSPTSRSYWLRAKNPAIEILDPAMREQALASACRMKQPWAFRPRKPAPAPMDQAAGAPPDQAATPAPKPSAPKSIAKPAAPEPRLPNCFPSIPRGLRKVYIPPTTQAPHPHNHTRR